MSKTANLRASEEGSEFLGWCALMVLFRMRTAQKGLNLLYSLITGRTERCPFSSKMRLSHRVDNPKSCLMYSIQPMRSAGITSMNIPILGSKSSGKRSKNSLDMRT